MIYNFSNNTKNKSSMIKFSKFSDLTLKDNNILFSIPNSESKVRFFNDKNYLNHQGLKFPEKK